MIVPWPDANDSKALPTTVPAAGLSARMAMPGVAEATSRSPI